MRTLLDQLAATAEVLTPQPLSVDAIGRLIEGDAEVLAAVAETTSYLRR